MKQGKHVKFLIYYLTKWRFVFLTCKKNMNSFTLRIDWNTAFVIKMLLPFFISCVSVY